MARHRDIEKYTGFEQQPPSPVVAPKVLYLPTERIRPQVRFMHESRGAVLDPRIVRDYCLAMFHSAHGSLTVDGQHYPIEPNRLLVMPPFRPHQIRLESAADPLHIAVHCDMAPDFPDDCALPDRSPYEIRFIESLRLPASSVLPTNVHWYDYMLEAVEFFWIGTSKSLLQADAAVFRLIAAGMVFQGTEGRHSESTAGNRGDAAVARVLAHLKENLAEDVPLSTLARIGAVSVPYLNRLFRTRLGYPPRVYLTRMRMTKVRELLRDDRLSVKEIAHRVGYPDSHSFGRIFHRLDGRTPSEYRAVQPQKPAS